MTPGKRALVLSFSRIATDPRVMRQLRSLEPRFALTVAGFGAPPPGDLEFLALPEQAARSLQWLAGLCRLALRRHSAYFSGLPFVSQARQALAGRRFDLVVCNDVQALPLALELAGGAPVVLDAHEYSPLEFEDRWHWRLLHQPFAEHVCRTFLPRVRAMTTVARGIADAYRDRYAAAAEVVYSAPPRAALRPAPVQPGRVRMIHHGAALPSRRIESMIDAMRRLDARFELDLILVPGVPAYVEDLRRRAAGDARIRFLPPVAMGDIVPVTNQYDVGLFLLPPTNFNYAHALPNKFFEFIQARLAVAIGPSPEMKRLVERYDCGIVADDFTPEAMARALNALTPERLAQLKANADRAAEELCWEKQEPVFLAAVERALQAAA